MPEQADIELCIQFLGTVERVLSQIVEEPRRTLGTALLDGGPLRESLNNSWPEIQGRLQLAQSRLREPFSPAEEDRFRLHGLGGEQLAFKVGVVEVLAARWNGAVRKWLKKLLEAIDALLDSLEHVVPGLGAVKEIKEALESLVED